MHTASTVVEVARLPLAAQATIWAHAQATILAYAQAAHKPRLGLKPRQEDFWRNPLLEKILEGAIVHRFAVG